MNKIGAPFKKEDPSIESSAMVAEEPAIQETELPAEEIIEEKEQIPEVADDTLQILTDAKTRIDNLEKEKNELKEKTQKQADQLKEIKDAIKKTLYGDK